jgi:iron complex transport system ATP-binding protein
MLSTDHLTLGYDREDIIVDLSLELPQGKITALVGANGCGKSTLLRGVARLLRPRGGSILLDGQEIHQIPTRQLAARLGVLPQAPVAPEGLTVRELVAQGRYPHQRWYQQWSENDERAARHALEITDTVAIADRPVDSLSGGQRQRAWIAMALAQETEILLLDEPTTYLDLAHQVEVLDLLVDLNAEGRTIIMVLHDLNHACRYADHLLAMKDGAVIAQGDPSDVITAAMVEQVFGLKTQIIPDPVTGTPICIPVARHSRIVRKTTASSVDLPGATASTSPLAQSPSASYTTGQHPDVVPNLHK